MQQPNYGRRVSLHYGWQFLPTQNNCPIWQPTHSDVPSFANGHFVLEQCTTFKLNFLINLIPVSCIQVLQECLNGTAVCPHVALYKLLVAKEMKQVWCTILRVLHSCSGIPNGRLGLERDNSSTGYCFLRNSRTWDTIIFAAVDCGIVASSISARPSVNFIPI